MPPENWRPRYRVGEGVLFHEACDAAAVARLPNALIYYGQTHEEREEELAAWSAKLERAIQAGVAAGVLCVGDGVLREVPRDRWGEAYWRETLRNFDTTNCHTWIRRSDFERFIVALPPLPPPNSFLKFVRGLAPQEEGAQPTATAAVKSRAGRKPGHDWGEAELFVKQLWKKWGDPDDDQNKRDDWKSDTDVAKRVLEHLTKLAPTAEPPDLVTVRARLRPVLAELRKNDRN